MVLTYTPTDEERYQQNLRKKMKVYKRFKTNTDQSGNSTIQKNHLILIQIVGE